MKKSSDKLQTKYSRYHKELHEGLYKLSIIVINFQEDIKPSKDPNKIAKKFFIIKLIKLLMFTFYSSH